MRDVSRSTTTALGEQCAIAALITKTHTSPAICSDFGINCELISLNCCLPPIFFRILLHTYSVAKLQISPLPISESSMLVLCSYREMTGPGLEPGSCHCPSYYSLASISSQLANVHGNSFSPLSSFYRMLVCEFYTFSTFWIHNIMARSTWVLGFGFLGFYHTNAGYKITTHKHNEK